MPENPSVFLFLSKVCGPCISVEKNGKIPMEGFEETE